MIPCDIVAAAVGVRPRVELARAAGLPCDRGILVDEYLRAGDPDIYAAGDIAETAEPAPATARCRCCGTPRCSRAGSRGSTWPPSPLHAYEQDAPINVTRLAGLHTTIIGLVGSGTDADLEGLSRGDSEVWSELCDQAIVESERGDAHVRLTLGEHTIAGAVVMGDQTVSFPLQDLIDDHVDVTAPWPRWRRRGRRSWRSSTACGRTGRPAAPERAGAAGAGTMNLRATR